MIAEKRQRLRHIGSSIRSMKGRYMDRKIVCSNIRARYGWKFETCSVREVLIVSFSLSVPAIVYSRFLYVACALLFGEGLGDRSLTQTRILESA